jgi:hypothetical protein
MINSVQVVARELLAQYSKQHKKNLLLGVIQNWTATAGDKLRTRYIPPDLVRVSIPAQTS